MYLSTSVDRVPSLVLQDRTDFVLNDGTLSTLVDKYTHIYIYIYVCIYQPVLTECHHWCSKTEPTLFSMMARCRRQTETYLKSVTMPTHCVAKLAPTVRQSDDCHKIQLMQTRFAGSKVFHREQTHAYSDTQS